VATTIRDRTMTDWIANIIRLMRPRQAHQWHQRSPSSCQKHVRPTDRPTDCVRELDKVPPSRHFRIASRHGAKNDLTLIPRLSLSLLFNNHRSHPVPIRGYHLQILLTLAYTSSTPVIFSASVSLFPRPHFPSHLSPLLLHTPILCAYSCYISLYGTIPS